MDGESVGYFLSVEIKISSFCFHYGIFLRTLPPNMKTGMQGILACDKFDKMNKPKAVFREINESYTLQEAIAEAKRCLNCKNPSCKKGCPIENHIPEFIHELSKGNMRRVSCRLFVAVWVRRRSNVRGIVYCIRRGRALKLVSWNALWPILIRK